MKQIIKVGSIFIFALLLASISFAQGIRKHYEEMTDAERDALIDAYWLLADDVDENGPNGGLIAEIGDFHQDHFRLGSCNCPDPIHNNTIDLDVFLAWHRQASVELQRAMKDGMSNEWITIPFWDWTLSNSKSDALWGSDWIGPFDSVWSLNRATSSNQSFPVQSDIDDALTETNFFQFSLDEVEENPIHVVGHTWTGGSNGTMAMGDSPKDPAFFFHHNMVDKIWADWYELHGVAGADYYQKTDMPRYDGTHINSLGQQLPTVNPDDIADPRSLGIFYANAGIAVLDKYTVANTSTTDEKFGYQFLIESKDNFTIPSGKSATFKSCDKIHLLPGFHAESGSNFHAKVDTDCDFTTPAKPVNLVFNTVQKEGYERNNVYAKQEVAIRPELDPSLKLTITPNPFQTTTKIEYNLETDTEVKMTITDVAGKIVAQPIDNTFLTKGDHQLDFDAGKLNPGLYLCSLYSNASVITKQLIITK